MKRGEISAFGVIGRRWRLLDRQVDRCHELKEAFRQQAYLDLAGPGRSQHRVTVVAGPMFLEPDDNSLGIEPLKDFSECLSRVINERGIQAQLPHRAARELA